MSTIHRLKDDADLLVYRSLSRRQLSLLQHLGKEQHEELRCARHFLARCGDVSLQIVALVCIPRRIPIRRKIKGGPLPTARVLPARSKIGGVCVARLLVPYSALSSALLPALFVRPSLLAPLGGASTAATSMDSQLTDLASAWVEGSDSSQPGAKKAAASRSYPARQINTCNYPQCGKTFSRPYDLTRHRCIHFAYNCLVCYVPGCKYKKKKTWHRRDKFREHINTHRDKARVECPLHGCGSVLLFGDELEAHLAQGHHFFERFRHEKFFRDLHIDIAKGRWKCPINCDYELDCEKPGRLFQASTHPFYEAPKAFKDHFKTHEWEDRVQFAAPLETCGIDPGYGVATCPICLSKVCKSDSYIIDLLEHIELNHGDDLQEHAQKLAELLGFAILSVFFLDYPLLCGVIRGALETRKALTLNKESGTEPSPLANDCYEDTISSVESTSRSKKVVASNQAECDFGSLDQAVTIKSSTSVLQSAINSAGIPGQHYSQQHSDFLTYTAAIEDVYKSTATVSQNCSADVLASPSGSLYNNQSQLCNGYGLNDGQHSSVLQPRPRYTGFDANPVTADLATNTMPIQNVVSDRGYSSIAHGVGNVYMYSGSPIDTADYRHSNICAALQGNGYDQGLSNKAREQHLIAAYGLQQQNNSDFAKSTGALPSWSNIASGQPYITAYHQPQPTQQDFQIGPTFSQPIPGFTHGQPGVVFNHQYQPIQYDFQLMPNTMMPDPAMVPNTMMPNIPLTIVSDASGQQYAVPSNQLYPTTSGISMMPFTTQPFLENVPAFQDNLQIMDEDWNISDD